MNRPIPHQRQARRPAQAASQRQLLVITTRAAVLIVAANGLLMAVAGVSAPLGWVLLPGVVAVSAHPRTALLLASWTAILITLSVLVPFVPGHRTDTYALIFTCGYLMLLPAVAWIRRSRHDRRNHCFL